MKVKKTSPSLNLILLMLCLMVPDAHAVVYIWTGNPDTLVISAAKHVSSLYGGFILGFYIMLIFLLAVIGVVVGYILLEKVRGRYVVIGSVVYWAFALLYLYVDWTAVFLPVAIVLSTFMVLSSNITYIVIYIVRRRRLNAQ